jgi:CNT family concentrative nucleoside transporter
MERVISFLGLFVMIGLAWLMSSNKRRFPWRVVVGGLVLQLGFAFLILRTGPGIVFFEGVDNLFNKLMDCVNAGSSFMFGVNPRADDPPLTPPVTLLRTFAFGVLPSIIFFAALMQALYYMGVMQKVVRGLGYVVQRTLGTTGPESLAAAANIFLGQTEAPLVVKPYVRSMTRSELMAVMVPGFGSTAGGVLIAYKGMGVDAGHLLTASVLSAPASLLIAKVLQPEVEKSTATGHVNLDMGDSGANVLEAISIGTLEGLKLALNVGAMLIAFIAIITLADVLLGWSGHAVHDMGEWMGWLQPGWTFDWSLSAIFSRVFAPLAWCMGIPWEDCPECGDLLGTKMVANEFLAYSDLSAYKAGTAETTMSPRAIAIMTYALCGFANFSSIGIQIGGIGGMAPERQRDLAQLGLRAMLGGALANFMTACIAGMLL